MSTLSVHPSATGTPASASASASAAASARTPAELRERLIGAVLLPGDEGYDAARAGFNLMFDQRPAVIVAAASTADVAEALRFAVTADLRVAVHSTGHGVARVADGALMIATAGLDSVTIDPVARRARIGGGARWAAVHPLAAEHGLTALLGSTTDVSAVGYTLGGGMGWIGRRYGLCSDSVAEFELVTPDGTVLRAADDENPEVFWALKGGGGGSLGVVTAMEVELYPVAEVYAGNLFYPVELAREVMQRFRTWTDGADERLTSAVVLMNFPPIEEIPEPIRGKSFVLVRGCWSGDLAEGQALIDEWRQWRTPAMDMFGPMPFAMSDLISQDPTDPMPAILTGECFDELHDNAIDVLIDRVVPRPGTPPLILMAEIRQAGGAIRRNVAAASNDRGRTSEYLLTLGSLVPFPHAALAVEAHLRGTREKLAPYVTGATYLNFTEGEEKHERTASAYSPQNLARLRAVKVALDPDNRFCHGFGLL